MKYYIEIFESNWADEFDIHGFRVVTEDQKNTFWEWFESDEAQNDIQFPVERYFGTNEAITFDTLEDYRDCFEYKEISKPLYDELKTLFPYYFGSQIEL